jgi:hypothetical protein
VSATICEECGEIVVVDERGRPPQRVECSWVSREGTQVLVYHDQSACVRFLAKELKETKDKLEALRYEFRHHSHSSGSGGVR